MAEHPTNHFTHWVSAITGATIAAPYVLPFVGIGSSDVAQKALDYCGSGFELGRGLAGKVNHGINAIPGIGPHLAAGSWGGVLASGILGMGGQLLGSYIERHYDATSRLPWGKIIRYAALTTSLLIALPTLLSGLSVGIAFIASLTGNMAFASQVLGAAASTLGLVGGTEAISAGAGFVGLLPHLLSCGVAMLPFLSSILMKPHEKPPEEAMERHNWSERVRQPEHISVAQPAR